MFVPVELQYSVKFESDEEYARKYVKDYVEKQKKGCVSDVQIVLNRKLKINTMLSLDGLQMSLRKNDSGGKQIGVSPITPLVLGPEMESYLKRLDSFRNKRKINASIQPDELFDEITLEKNLLLYDMMVKKINEQPFRNLPTMEKISKLTNSGRDKFQTLPVCEQIELLCILVKYFNRSGSGGVNLTAIGGGSANGSKRLNACLSNWKKTYRDVRIVDSSPAGLSETLSENLLELL